VKKAARRDHRSPLDPAHQGILKRTQKSWHLEQGLDLGAIIFLF
jgi:hypothetical protein